MRTDAPRRVRRKFRIRLRRCICCRAQIDDGTYCRAHQDQVDKMTAWHEKTRIKFTATA